MAECEPSPLVAEFERYPLVAECEPSPLVAECEPSPLVAFAPFVGLPSVAFAQTAST